MSTRRSIHLFLVTVIAFAGASAFGRAAAAAAPAAPHAGQTWYVTTAADAADDGDVAARTGSLRFALGHAAAGDLVSFDRLDAVDHIGVGSTLVVPGGVAVGRTREQPCGDAMHPLASLRATSTAVNPVISLGANATLRSLAIGGGYTSLRIDGANADVCGVALGLLAEENSVPPLRAALVVEGERAVIHRNVMNSFMVVGVHGSDTRFGDAVGGSGESNQGLCGNRGLCGITVYADASGAARRVTIRDAFARGLTGLVGQGVPGGDDDPMHANNWVQTPAIDLAETTDGFATVRVTGTASPGSLVDVFFDNRLTIARQAPVTADAGGAFTFIGPLPGRDVRVIAVSTLVDPAFPDRLGSSSQFSDPIQVVESLASTTIALAPASLTFVADVGGAAPGAQALTVSATPDDGSVAWQAAVSTADGLPWLLVSPDAGSGSGSIAVSVDATGLAPGVYNGSIEVTVDGTAIRARADVVLEVVATATDGRAVWLPMVVR